MYYVYILQSLKDQRRYIGLTKNLRKRFDQHQSGSTGYSSKYKPWTFKWYCAFVNERPARLFEKYLKSGSGFAFSNKRLIPKS